MCYCDPSIRTPWCKSAKCTEELRIRVLHEPEDVKYDRARIVLTSEHARYRLANLLAHGYSISEIRVSYIVIANERLYSDVIIFPDGKSYSRCTG